MAILTCEKCGRLLNRATGECPVHGLVDGVSPEARELTPAEALKEAARLMAPESAEPRPAAMPIAARPVTEDITPSPPARLQLAANNALPATISVPASQKATTDVTRPQAVLPAAAVPPPVVRVPVGVLTGLRSKGKRVDLFAFQGALVIARAKRRNGHTAERAQLTPGQLVALDSGNELLEGDQVVAIDIWERWPGGMVTISLARGVRRVTWRGKGHHEADVETVLARAFLGRVDQAKPSLGPRARRFWIPALAAIVLITAAITGSKLLLKPAPPPPPVKTTPTTLSVADRQVITILSPVCPGWKAFVAAQTRGLAPDRVAVKNAATAMVGPVNQAVAVDGTLSPAEQQAPYLISWTGKPAEEANREPVARLFAAMDALTDLCGRVPA